jgi:hypothetical protein
MGVQESLNAIYSELVNRWIRLNGTANPNSNSSLDGTPIGTFYAKTGVDPVVIYSKNRLGSNGWDEYLLPPLVGKIVYVDKNYTGSLSTGNADAPFKTIQGAINYAEASLSPSSTSRVTIYVTGVYNEEIRIHKSYVDLIGYGTAAIKNSAQQNKTDNFVATGGVSEYFALSGGRSFIWASQTVTIASVVWTRVNNFNASTPTSKHYIVIHPEDGSGITRIQLGDGVKGALAPVGAAVVVTYRKYLPSIVLSNGTNASINAFHASDVYSDLVYNPGDPVPEDNQIENFDIWGLEFLGVKGDASPSTTSFAQNIVVRNVLDSQGAFGTNWYAGSNWYIRNASLVDFYMDIFHPVGRVLTLINVSAANFQNCWSWYTWLEYVVGDPNGEPNWGFGYGYYITDCSIGTTSVIGGIDFFPLRGQIGLLYLDSTGDGWYYSYLEDVNIWGNCTVTSRAGGDFINCDIAGMTLLGGGPNIPVNITGSEFTHIYPVVDSANRIVFTGRDAPHVATRFTDAAYTGTYSNGSDFYPFTTAALARASSATAKLVSKDFIANTDVDTGTETVDSFPDTVGSSAVWTVKISKGANIQILLASAVWDAATDVISSIGLSTQSNIGVIDVTLAVSLAANVVSLTATATSDDWIVQVVERTIYA